MGETAVVVDIAPGREAQRQRGGVLRFVHRRDDPACSFSAKPGAMSEERVASNTQAC